MSTLSKTALWARQNPERWREHQRRYQEKRRAPCKKCGGKLPFPSPGRQYHDECRPTRNEINQRARTRRLTELRAYKLARGCDRCGYTKSGSALDFHHRDPAMKKHRVWVPRGEEYEKCDLLCANCHREQHHKDDEEATP